MQWTGRIRARRPCPSVEWPTLLLASVGLACATTAGRGAPPPARPGLTAHATALTRVTRDPAAESQPRLSPDGATLVVSVRDPTLPEAWGLLAQFRVVVHDLATGARRTLANPGADAVFFPGGGRIVYADTRMPAPHFVVYDQATGRRAPLVERVPGLDPQQVSIRPDGGMIAYGAIIDGAYTICTIRMDGTGFATHGPGYSPTWHPTRPLLAFDCEVDDVGQTFLLDLEAGERTQLTSGPAKHTFPVWAPDGEWLCIVSNRTGDSHLYAMRPDGSELTQLTTGAARASHPHWAADGNIYFTSDAGAPTYQEKPFPWRWTFADIWRLTPVLPD